jgi:hypothetical protein
MSFLFVFSRNDFWFFSLILHYQSTPFNYYCNFITSWSCMTIYNLPFCSILFLHIICHFVLFCMYVLFYVVTCPYAPWRIQINLENARSDLPLQDKWPSRSLQQTSLGSSLSIFCYVSVWQIDQNDERIRNSAYVMIKKNVLNKQKISTPESQATNDCLHTGIYS